MHRFSRALRTILSAAPLACALACRAPAVQAPPPAAPAAAATTDTAATTSAPVPATAAPEGPPVARCEPADDAKEGCFPDEAYRTWLCDQSGPATAVSLFRKGSPWTRAYVARDLDSWDPTRRHAQKTHLALDEEVIVLHPNKAKSDVMVVGATNAFGWSSVDALRADGTCVSLMADEVTSKRPPTPKHAPVAWEKVDDQTRSAWLALPDVRKRVDAMTHACAAGTSGQGCVKAKTRVTDAVVAHE
jgi:hypothetical protein